MLSRLLSLLFVAATLSAAPITVINYTLNGTGNSSSERGQTNTSLALSGGGIIGFAFSGDAVLFGAGQPIVIGEQFDGPIELRFTNAVVSCNGVFACSGRIDLTADLFLSTTTATQLPLFVGIEGTATGDPIFGTMSVTGSVTGPTFSVRPIFDGPITVIPGGNLTAPTIPARPLPPVGGSNLSIEPTFSYSFPSGSSIPIATNLTLALSIAFNNLGPGTTVNLPDSAWLALGQPGSAIPEPGTLLLLSAGLAGLYWFRRR